MNALADWIAKLAQILYCISIDICIICSIIYQADCNRLVDVFLSILVELFVLASGLFSDWGGGFFRAQRTPPPLATALSSKFPTQLKKRAHSYSICIAREFPTSNSIASD